jgi:hypothetical protein
MTMPFSDKKTMTDQLSAKPGVDTLAELDRYRYIDAPSRFSKKTGSSSLGLADLQKLVDWKL